MINNYNFLFNYFKIKKNISLDNLEQNNYIFNIKYNDEKSILENYNLEIKSYIDKNLKNSDIKNIESSKILNNISDIFNKLLLNKNIQEFFTNFILYKDNINTNRKYIDHFSFNINKLNIANYINYNEDLFFMNPINSTNFNSVLNNNFQSEINNISYNNNSKNIKTIIDILIQGDIINLSLPSIGPVSNYLSKDNKNYIDFIKLIINNKKVDTDIGLELPIKTVKAGKIISDILLDIYIDRSITLSDNNDTKKIIENIVKGINVNLENIYYIKKNSKSIKRINGEYIIPYTFDKKKNELVYVNKGHSDKIKNYTDLVNYNNELLLYVSNDVFQKDNGVKNLEKKNYKNVLACYLFYIINVLSNILIEYVNQITNMLKDISESKDKRFKNLNIEGAFKYSTLLKKSTLKFKYILFNNFYQLFSPAKILSGNYGMKMNENNNYYPESIFLTSNENIFNNYPFQNSSTQLLSPNLKNIIIDEDRLKKFIISIKDRNDIHNPDIKLEFGGYIFNNNTLIKKSINILEDYYKIIQIENNFNLFIIGIIINYFKNGNVPYELIEDIEGLKYTINSYISNNYKKEVRNKLLTNFQFNISKSTDYYIKMNQINIKIEATKQSNIENLYNLKDIFFIYYKIYLLKTKLIKVITEKYISDTELKFQLLQEYSRLKSEYQVTINRSLKL